MTFEEFNKELYRIVNIVKFEDGLDAIEAEYPDMSAEAAKLLEYIVTGTLTDDGLITWWLYALDCGKSDGNLYMPGRTVNIKTANDLWNALNDKELHKFVTGCDFEQMEISLE